MKISFGFGGDYGTNDRRAIGVDLYFYTVFALMQAQRQIKALATGSRERRKQRATKPGRRG
jgi:hypothetical protein